MSSEDKKIIKDDYMGDGVYASYDGYGIALDLRGQDTFTRIYLEPGVLEAVNRFAVRAAAARKRHVEKMNATD